MRPRTTPDRLPLLLVLLLASCGGGGHGHDHGHGHGHGHGEHGHDGHDHGSGEGHGEDEPHVHVAPRGGLLLTLAEESAHAELLHDPETGTLELFLLGPHAEQPVRSGREQLEVSLVQPSTLVPLRLQAVESALTGETVGDSSHFRVTDPSLKTERLEGTIVSLEHRGTVFEGVPFALPLSDEEQ